MSKDRPDDKNKVIDITGLLERRRKARETRQAESEDRDGPKGRTEIPPPPMLGGIPEEARSSLARIRAAAKPLADLKKDPAVKRAMLLLPDWITPDGVTYFRTMLIVPILILLQLGWHWSALVTFVFAQLLDFVDGALAEARDCKTEWGAFIDPLADKIVTLFTFAVIIDEVPWWWSYPLFGFSLMMASALTFVRWRKRKNPKKPSVAANLAGKAKLVCEATGLSLCILGIAVSMPELLAVGMAFCTLAFGLSLLSLTGQLRD